MPVTPYLLRIPGMYWRLSVYKCKAMQIPGVYIGSPACIRGRRLIEEIRYINTSGNVSVQCLPQSAPLYELHSYFNLKFLHMHYEYFHFIQCIIKATHNCVLILLYSVVYLLPEKDDLLSYSTSQESTNDMVSDLHVLS